MSFMIVVMHVLSVAAHHGHGHHPVVSQFCTVSRQGVVSCVRSMLTR